MAKKRTSLDALFENSSAETTEKREVETKSKSGTDRSRETKPVKVENQNAIIKQTVYLPVQVHEQLRSLAFEERKKMHDYLVEGLDRVFKNRGLKTFSELLK